MKTVDTFYAVDFDRCLGNVDACFGLLQEVITDLTDVDMSELMVARRHVEATGETFLVFDYLASITTPENGERIESEFIRRGQASAGSLLEPGARELIDWLTTAEKEFGIITHGEQRWQIAKIKAAGLGDMPRMIASHKNKAAFVASWQNDQGSFDIAASVFNGDPVHADHVVLIDDRAVAFEGLPAQARGYWVVIDGDVKPFQEGSLPAHVTHIERISDIISYEK